MVMILDERIKKDVYLCNMKRQCNERENCLKNGGECYCTTDIQYALFPTPVDHFEI